MFFAQETVIPPPPPGSPAWVQTLVYLLALLPVVLPLLAKIRSLSVSNAQGNAIGTALAQGGPAAAMKKAEELGAENHPIAKTAAFLAPKLDDDPTPRV